ncbi:hypothetical protein L5515_017144 [Caenorhabditis briggsae]|uniref:Uncharacterized protein n=1 Tax=Caenorhabditis briggsae TaxID=6238 RepID=A0AAE9FDZ2_CAEBR|nr:hypothetical protein L5515_017144 [Caenorhabditis briggsae]
MLRGRSIVSLPLRNAIGPLTMNSPLSYPGYIDVSNRRSAEKRSPQHTDRHNPLSGTKHTPPLDVPGKLEPCGSIVKSQGFLRNNPRRTGPTTIQGLIQPAPPAHVKFVTPKNNSKTKTFELSQAGNRERIDHGFRSEPEGAKIPFLSQALITSLKNEVPTGEPNTTNSLRSTTWPVGSNGALRNAITPARSLPTRLQNRTRPYGLHPTLTS